MLPVETHELPDQAAIRIIRPRLDREIDRAEVLGKVVHEQRHLTNYAKGAASAALQRPKQIRIGASIRDTNLAVGADDLGLEQAARCGAIVLRETSEAAALHQARESHRQTAAALNVFPTLGGNCLIGPPSDRSRTDRHGRLRLHNALAS